MKWVSDINADVKGDDDDNAENEKTDQFSIEPARFFDLEKDKGNDSMFTALGTRCKVGE
jgi:hypothetical protein